MGQGITDWTKKTPESETALQDLYERGRELGIHWTNEGITEELWQRILTHPTYQRVVEKVGHHYEVTLKFWVTPERTLSSTMDGWSPEVATLRAYVDVMTQPLD